jgi:hypothetical protein
VAPSLWTACPSNPDLAAVTPNAPPSRRLRVDRSPTPYEGGHTIEEVELADLDWRAHTVASGINNPQVWAFFLIVVVIQIVVLGDEIWIKIFFWMFPRAPYLKTHALVNTNGGGRVGGILWHVAQALHEADFSLNNVQLYSGCWTTKADWLATSIHQDGHLGYGKCLIRINGSFCFFYKETGKGGFELLYKFDCHNTARAIRGDRNALCGLQDDGTNSGIFHGGMKQPNEPSLVLQVHQRGVYALGLRPRFSPGIGTKNIP